jgi:hypothetical protein
MKTHSPTLIEAIFSGIPRVFQSLCHRGASSFLSTQATEPVQVESSPFQGSQSYTGLARITYNGSTRTVVQFRREQLNLDRGNESRFIHGGAPRLFHISAFITNSTFILLHYRKEYLDSFRILKAIPN